jgi:hypothetical protein
VVGWIVREEAHVPLAGGGVLAELIVSSGVRLRLVSKLGCVIPPERLVDRTERAPFEVSDLARVGSMPALELEVLSDRFIEDAHAAQNDTVATRRSLEVPKPAA